MCDRRLTFLARRMSATADGPCRRLVPHNSYGIITHPPKSDAVPVNTSVQYIWLKVNSKICDSKLFH